MDPAFFKNRSLNAGGSPLGCLAFLPRVFVVAQRLGYVLAVHGSMTRDCDFVACPWVEDAVPAHELVEAIRAACGGVIANDGAADALDYTRRNPEPKPHGRLAWVIQLGGEQRIDLSVMPRAASSLQYPDFTASNLALLDPPA